MSNYSFLSLFQLIIHKWSPRTSFPYRSLSSQMKQRQKMIFLSKRLDTKKKPRKSKGGSLERDMPTTSPKRPSIQI